MGLTGTLRRLVTVSIVAMAGATGSVIGAPVAGAQLELLSCVGSGSNTYQPGVTLQPRLISVHSRADYTACTGNAGITSGHYQASVNGVVSCVGGGFTITVTITWNTGETSTITAIGIVSLRPANEIVVLYQGTVTAGRFAGATTLQTAALLNTTPAQCLTSEGVTGTSGPAAITITGLQ